MLLNRWAKDKHHLMRTASVPSMVRPILHRNRSTNTSTFRIYYQDWSFSFCTRLAGVMDATAAWHTAPPAVPQRASQSSIEYYSGLIKTGAGTRVVCRSRANPPSRRNVGPPVPPPSRFPQESGSALTEQQAGAPFAPSSPPHQPFRFTYMDHLPKALTALEVPPSVHDSHVQIVCGWDGRAARATAQLK